MAFSNFDDPDFMTSSYDFCYCDFCFIGEGSDNGFNAFQNDENIQNEIMDQQIQCVPNDAVYVDLSGFYNSIDYKNYRNHTPGTSPIHIACALGRLDVVRLLLKKGVSINTKDEKGWTPLFYATLEGHTHLVEFLCSNKALLNLKSKAKITVFDLAHRLKKTEIKKILKKYGPKCLMLQLFNMLFRK